MLYTILWSVLKKTQNFIEIELTSSKNRRVELKIMIFSFESRFHPKILVKSLRGCEKWILQKISHRSSNQKNLNFYFSSKKIILTFWKNIFSKMRKIKKIPSVDFFHYKFSIIDFLENFPNLKIFFKFIFFRWKKSLDIFFESLDRCKFFRRTYFSHPRSDLISISGWNLHLFRSYPEKIVFVAKLEDCTRTPPPRFNLFWMPFGPIALQDGSWAILKSKSDQRTM